jgi:hypothetical protein
LTEWLPIVENDFGYLPLGEVIAVKQAGLGFDMARELTAEKPADHLQTLACLLYTKTEQRKQVQTKNPDNIVRVILI